MSTNDTLERFWDFRASHWVTAFLTLALVGIGISQVCIYKRQTEIFYSQRKLMEAGERPWVSIDTGQLTGFGFQDDIGAYAAFDLGVSAIGQTPAHRVRALGRLVTRENFTKPALQTRAVCDEAEKTALRDVTVFPSQKNITVRASAIWGKDFAKSSNAKSVNFVVLGCLAYTDSFDGSHHTGFTFDLSGGRATY